MLPTFPIGAAVNPPPIAPPMMERPLMCPTTAVYFMTSAAIFVNVPVATSQQEFGGVASTALAIASTASTDRSAGRAGVGSRSVPASPDSPRNSVSGYPSKLPLLHTMDSVSMDSGPDQWLACSSINRNVWFPNGRQYTPCIFRRVVYTSISMDSA